MSTGIPIQIKCPQCGSEYSAQVESIIDVGRDPEAKKLLLGGTLNTVVCPVCGTRGRVSTPLIYHDPDKELLLLYVPPEMNLTIEKRERLTGELVNALMATLPAEQRRGYFLHPRNVLTMQGLIDEILKADGITPEMIEEQHARNELLQTLLGALSDRERLNELIREHSAEIDYPFLLMVSTAAEASAGAEQADLAEKLLELRDVLLEQTTIALPEALPPETTPAQMVDRMVAAPDRETRWALVLYNRPLLDYAFFQELTSRIDSATGEQADTLRALRAELLDMLERADRAAQAAQQQKMRVLEEVRDAPDPAEALRERRHEIDPMFMALLSSARQQARERGDLEASARLTEVYDAAVDMLQEDLPPELRLVNQLLTTNEETLPQVLDEHEAELTPEFVEFMGALADDLDQQQRPDMAQYMRQVRDKVRARIGS